MNKTHSEIRPREPDKLFTTRLDANRNLEDGPCTRPEASLDYRKVIIIVIIIMKEISTAPFFHRSTGCCLI